MIFTVEHIYCGMIKIITGYSFADACKRANIIPNLWNIMEVEIVD